MEEELPVESAESESPPHVPGSNPAPAADGARSVPRRPRHLARADWAARVAANPLTASRPTQSWWKKILVPAVLFVIGAAVIVVGLLMYPRRPGVSTPALPTLGIRSQSAFVDEHIELIYYVVRQAGPVAHVLVGVQLGGPNYAAGGHIRVPHGVTAVISFVAGPPVLHCSPACKPASKGNVANATSQFVVGPSGVQVAIADFVVRARSYGVAANGATEAIGFPSVDYSGTHQAEAEFGFYYVPSVRSYDWSSLPPEEITKKLVTWQESILPGNAFLLTGVTNARVATGVNHSAQDRDSFLTVVAGVLFGIGGAAIVAAVPEALRD